MRGVGHTAPLSTVLVSGCRVLASAAWTVVATLVMRGVPRTPTTATTKTMNSSEESNSPGLGRGLAEHPPGTAPTRQSLAKTRVKTERMMLSGPQRTAETFTCRRASRRRQRNGDVRRSHSQRIIHPSDDNAEPHTAVGITAGPPAGPAGRSVRIRPSRAPARDRGAAAVSGQSGRRSASVPPRQVSQ